MRFSDYLRGERIVIDSALPPRRIADRLDAGIPRRWRRFPSGVVGWTELGFFSLRYRRSAWLRREWLPVLVGRIRARGDGSRITMRYRVRRWLFLVVLLWACLLYRIFMVAPLPQMYEILFLISSAMLLLGAL